MRFTCTFESVDMGSEIICVPVGEGSDHIKGVLKLNAEGFEIFEMLMNGMSEEDIVNKLQTKYENDRNSLETYVKGVIGKLIKAGVIEE